jgi:DNA-binding transcriptional ArsR family regulator
MLVKSADVNHALSAEEIARKIGKRHSVAIYHLEQLARCELVTVVKHANHGSKRRRSIWGLNLKFLNLIREVYSYMLKTFYTAKELDDMCSVNKNVRSCSRGLRKKDG